MRADWCSRRSASVSGTRNVICCCSTPTCAAAARISSTDVAVGFVLFVFFIGTFRFLVLLFPAAARKIPVAAVGEYQTTGSETCVLERAPRFVACRATAPGKERLRSGWQNERYSLVRSHREQEQEAGIRWGALCPARQSRNQPSA